MPQRAVEERPVRVAGAEEALGKVEKSSRLSSMETSDTLSFFIPRALREQKCNKLVNVTRSRTKYMKQSIS